LRAKSLGANAARGRTVGAAYSDVLLKAGAGVRFAPRADGGGAPSLLRA